MKNTIQRPKYTWPLSVSHFRMREKFKLASWLITSKRWTQDKRVRELEIRMSEFAGCKYALFTSSGSTANSLLAMYVRDHSAPGRNTVVFPAVTWSTSVSPWIREGFTPKFVDVSLHNLCANSRLMERWLEKHHEEVACVFVTSLLGFSPDIEDLLRIQEKYAVPVMLDNCEATLTQYDGKNISSYFPSTTSTYFGHQIQTIEGGFLFTNSEEMYAYCLMLRDHGLTRCLPISSFPVDGTRYMNETRDPRFDFHCLGSNFRNSELPAVLGLMDIRRAVDYTKLRCDQYSLFRSLSNLKNNPCGINKALDVPFALPIICPIGTRQRAKYMDACSRLGIETRPLLAGNLLRHSAYAKYYPEYYPTKNISALNIENGAYTCADALDEDAFYVGLGRCTNDVKIKQLAAQLNQIL